MSEHENKNLKAAKHAHPISRREFALGSMAVLGTYSLIEADTLPPLSAEAQALKIEKTDAVQTLMDSRHITDDDVKRVIDHAEKTGKKLYQPGNDRFLSKLRVQKTYFYVEYSSAESGYCIHTVYAHRFLLDGEPI
jgi:hypothetical protein